MRGLSGQPALDLIVTMDDATSAILLGVPGRGRGHGLDVPRPVARCLAAMACR